MHLRVAFAWSALALAIGVPLALAAFSPYLAFRQPIYIAAGFAGIIALALLLVQPLLATDTLPGLSKKTARRGHRNAGGALALAVIIHVAGLWITSPPDVVDALLFRSPTPFSVWGVLAMGAVFAMAGLAVLRARIRVRVWRMGHGILAVVIVAGTILHAVLIEGTMEPISKLVLCLLVALASARALMRLRPWAGLWKRRAG